MPRLVLYKYVGENVFWQYNLPVFGPFCQCSHSSLELQVSMPFAVTWMFTHSFMWVHKQHHLDVGVYASIFMVYTVIRSKVYFTLRTDVTSQCISTWAPAFQPRIFVVAHIFFRELATARTFLVSTIDKQWHHVHSKSGIKFRNHCAIYTCNTLNFVMHLFIKCKL